MNWRTCARSLAVVLPVLAGLTACKGSSKQMVGLRRVDDLLGRIERVHVECELSRESARIALDTLHAVVALGTDAMASYAELVDALEVSEERAEALRAVIKPMDRAAEQVFEQWNSDLNSFTRAEMRKRSRDRMLDTRERYDAIITAAEPAREAYEELNAGLRDCVLFLGHDFNANAVAEIESDVLALTQLASELDERLEECREAAWEYLQTAAMPVRVEMAPIGGGEPGIPVDSIPPAADVIPPPG